MSINTNDSAKREDGLFICKVFSTEETSNVELDVKVGWLFQVDTDMGLLARVSCPKIDATGSWRPLVSFSVFPWLPACPGLNTLNGGDLLMQYHRLV